MENPLATTIHHRCSFKLRATSSVEEPWTKVAKSIRHWIEQSPQKAPPVTNKAFYGAWFFLGGEWGAPGSGYHFLKTARLNGNGDDQSPLHWALRYEHSGENAGRTWRTDIGVSQIDSGVFGCSIKVSYYMREGYIGKEPPAPLPTAPRLVGWLLSSSDWEAFAGSQRLISRPVVLKEGEGEEFRRALEDPDRVCPIVLVSRDFTNGTFLVDPNLLSRKLAGSAAVYKSQSSNLDKELEWCLGRRFSCWNGMVRVYQPGLRFDAPGAARRQRFFAGREIIDQGQDIIIEMLVRGIARRTRAGQPGAVNTIEDVASVERELRMAELKAAANDEERSEWVQLLEKTNVELETKKRRQEESIKQLEGEIADRVDTISRLEYEKKALTSRAADAIRVMKGMRTRDEAIDSLAQLPQSIRAVAELISSFHPNRIAFTERALKSAETCGFGRIGDAWSCLWAMATTLHDLFFSTQSARNIEADFQAASGFPLAMKEGGMTNDENKLMKLREDVFEGQDINITPHVKMDKGSTRAYFCPFRDGHQPLIVVGYIGHLKTAGTRRRKK